MRHLRTLPLLAIFAFTACATDQSRRDAYDRSLAHWQGATEESLIAAWGRPRFEEPVEGGKLLIYVHDQVGGYDNRPTFSIGLGGWNWGGGGSSVGAGVGVSAPVGSSSNANGCTTRFLVHQGKVESWTFEGGGCAPAF